MSDNNKDIEKNSDLWWDASLENKDNLKQSFSDLKNELNKLQNQVKEWQEKKTDKQKIDSLDKEIQKIDSKIKLEIGIEKDKKDWNITNRKDTYIKHMQKITQRLKDNPWEANQWRSDSAKLLLQDIYSSESNPIANSMQKIIRFILRS